MVHNDLKQKAIELRKQGYSYNLILKKIPIARSTLSRLLRDIPYEPNEEVKNRVRGAQVQMEQWARKHKEKSLVRALEEAQQELGSISKRDLFLLGIGLYIGEGTKTHGITSVINSEPDVINVAIRWFEEVFGLSTKNFHLSIHLYPDNNIEEALTFWSDITGILRSQFGKTQIDKRIKKISKRGMLKYGTAHLRIRACGSVDFGVFLQRKINALIREVYRQFN